MKTKSQNLPKHPSFFLYFVFCGHLHISLTSCTQFPPELSHPASSFLQALSVTIEKKGKKTFIYFSKMYIDFA